MTASSDRLALLLALAALGGCPSAPPADDDDSAPVGDDDDVTPPPDPLADVIGVFNLTNVRRPGGTDYVDFSGAFGPFATLDTQLIAPSAYLGQWGYDSPLWRFDLGAWPLPEEGEHLVIDLLAYTPWTPTELAWWDGGPRIGLGPYLSLRLLEDTLLAYQVDDPLNPGGAGWTAGGELTFQNTGGADVVGWTAATPAPLPLEPELLAPLPGSTVRTPAAHPFTVRWTPQPDDATVTVVLLQGLGVAYVAHVQDTGEHTIPAEILHDDLGVGTMELLLGRQIETVLDHPQGDILLRTRAEQRAVLELLPDLTLEPAYGSAGQTVPVDLRWFTGTLDGTTLYDLGDGVIVAQAVPNATDAQRAALTLVLEASAEIGARDAFVMTGGDSIEAPGAFTVLNLDPADDCAAADQIGGLGGGYWVSTTVGLTNDTTSGFACIPWTLNASDSVYRLDLEAGQTVLIEALQAAPADVAIALLTTCGDPASAVACADDGFEGDPEQIVYTATEAGPVYLVIDGYFLSGFGAPSGPVEIAITFPAPPSPITPPWIVPGTTQALSVQGALPWEGALTTDDVDLGDGLSALAVALGVDANELLINASADGAAATGPRTVTITNGAQGPIALEDALFVTGWPASDTCADAEAWGSVDPALGVTGWAAGATNAIDATSCFAWGSGGAEVMLALDLVAGELLSVSVISDEDAQLYLLEDCAAPMTACIEEASADDGFDGDPESFNDWLVPSTGRYTLVVDLFAAALDPSWSYELTIEVQ